MFKHQGVTRTLQHNLKIASLLSFVAGLVNVAGFLSVHRLTTNVTGHFAFMMDEVYRFRFWEAAQYLSYVLFFLAGAFSSGILVELTARRSERFMYGVPVLLEAILLVVFSLLPGAFLLPHAHLVACCLLFAMGMQNSLVTSISNAVVRTTHLTGLFTDLGIELSQLFFYKAPQQREKLFSAIRLRITVIGFFFIGGIIAGLLYFIWQMKVLLLGAFLLLAGLVYDNLRFRLIQLQKKLKQR